MSAATAVKLPSTDQDSLTLEELRAWTRQAIADYKAPDVLELVPELPLTPMGKVDKRALGERALSLVRVR